jgi:hypothetical protein
MPVNMCHLLGMLWLQNDYGGFFAHGSANFILTDSLIADSTLLVDFWAFAGEQVRYACTNSVCIRETN